MPLRPRELAVVAALALAGPGGATTDDIAELVWGGAEPATAHKTVQNHIRRIRTTAGAGLIETAGARYRLGEGIRVDARTATDAIDRADAGRGRHVHALDAAARSWRGTPYADLAEGAVVASERRRLDAIHRSLLAASAEARLAIGDADAAVRPLLGLLELDAYDERAWWLLAIAQYRAGRRRESLQALADARRRLAEVGLPPGAQLAQLERLVSVDDPAIHHPALLTESAAPTSVFVGREHQRNVLTSRVGGRHQAALVSGEPGAGKTSLARVLAAAATAKGCVVLWSDCDAQPTAPLAPIRQLIGSMPASTGRASLFDAAADAMAARGGGRPIVAIVDDAHLAGPTTLRLLAHLRDRLPDLYLVVTARRAHRDSVVAALSGGHPIEVVEVDGFDLEETEHWLHTITNPAPGWAAWLQAQAGGNPLLLRELVRELDLHEPPPDQDAAPLPVGIHALLLDRLRGLTVSGQHAIDAAAVLGMSFHESDLARLATDHQGVEETVASGILVASAEPGRLRFAHALVHQAAYRSLSEGARIELHDAAASMLAGRDPGEVARHHLEAASIDPARATLSARAAATAASEAFAHDEAAHLLGRALEVAIDARLDDHLCCELEVERGEALRRAGDRDQQPVLFDAAERAERLGAGDLLAQAALSICNIGVLTGSSAAEHEIIDVVERGLAAARSPALRAELAGAASWALAFTGQGPRCRALYERAEAEARALGDREVLGRVLPYALLGLARPDDLDRKAAIAGELVAIDDPLAVFQGYQLRFTRHLQIGDLRADEDLRELRRLADRMREPQRHLYVAWYDAARRHLAGDLDGAEATITASLDHGGAVPDSLAVAVYGAQILAIRAVQGRLPELFDTVTGLVADQPNVPAWSAAQAWIAAVAGDAPLATDAFDRCAANDFALLDDDITWTGAMTILAIAAGTLGDGARSAAVYRRLVPWSGRLSWVASCSLGPIDEGLALAARAMGDGSAADAHSAVAAAMLDRLR